MSKFESLFEDFTLALKRFDEIMKEPKNDIVRDSAIKRFEIVFDLGWKTLKAFLEDNHNISCVSPRNCFREAFRVGLLDYDDFWMQITSDRNYTVHTYSELLAEEIYKDFPKIFIFFKNLSEVLKVN